MKKEAIKNYLMVNGSLERVEDTHIFEKIDTPPIYEVIRVMDSVPLFLDDHLDRMEESAKIVGYNIQRNKDDIKKDIFKLIEENKIVDLNIKLLVTTIDEEEVFISYFIESFYPPKEYYEEGIHTILFRHERPNPNAKVLLTDFKENIKKTLDREDAFEALLVDSNDSISEGSRSNIFFVRDKKVYTAAAGDVLMGITRKYIMKACRDNGIELIEENYSLDDLSSLDGAFMSGTSVDVLPIASIGDLRIDSINNSIVKKLSKGYGEYVKMDIKNTRNL